MATKTFRYIKWEVGRHPLDCIESMVDTYKPGTTIIYRDLSTDIKKFIMFDDVKRAEEYMNSLRFPNLSAYLPKFVPRKICLDIDIPYQRQGDDTDDGLNDWQLDIYTSIINGLKQYFKIDHKRELLDMDIWVWIRHRPGKFSYRVICPYVLDDQDEQNHMIDQIRMYAVLEDDTYLDKWHCHMQLPNCYKTDGENHYRLEWNDELNDYNSEPSFEQQQIALFNFTDTWNEGMMLPRISPTKTKNDNASVAEVKDVLDAVEQIDEVKQWATIGTIDNKGFIPLKRIAPSRCPIHDRIHTSLGGYVFVSDNGAILQGCYASDAPAEGRPKCIKIGDMEATIDDETKLTYPDYRRFQELDNDGKKRDWHPRDVNKWVKDALAYVDNGANEFVLTLNTKITYTSDDKPITTTYYETVKPNKLLKNLDLSVNILNPMYDSTKPIAKDNKVYWFNNLAEYVKHCMTNRTNLMNTYNGVTFRPYAGKDAPYVGDNLNLFTGYSILNHKPEHKVDFTESKTFKHWRDAFCNSDDTVFDYFIKYFAQRVQFPHKRPDVAMVIQSDQGMGKDLMRLFMTTLFGESHILTYQNIGLFFKNFNVEQCGKILTFLNELADKGAHFAKHDQFKGEITKDAIRVEPKGMEVYNVPHCSGYVTFSQQENCLYVENSDRRLFMIKANNTHANDHDYFTPIINEMNDLDVVYGAYEYFMSIDLSNFVVRNFPMTDFKRDQLIRNLPAPIKFLMDVGRAAAGGDDHNFQNNAFVRIKDNEIKIRAPDMWRMFSEWCDDEKVNSRYTKTSFYEQLDKIGLERTTFRITTPLIRGYLTDVMGLERLIGNHIKQPNFKIIM